MKKPTRCNKDKLDEYERILQLLPESQKRPLKRIVLGNASQWLTTIPNEAGRTD